MYRLNNTLEEIISDAAEEVLHRNTGITFYSEGSLRIREPLIPVLKYLQRNQEHMSLYMNDIFLYSNDYDTILENIENSINTPPDFDARLIKIGRNNTQYQINILKTGSGVKIYDVLKKLTQQLPTRYTLLENLSVLLIQSKSHRASAILDTQNHTIICATNDCNTKLINTLYTLAPTIFGFYNKMDEKELAILDKLIENNEENDIDITALIEDLFADSIEAYKNKELVLLEKALTAGNTNNIEDLEHQLRNIASEIAGCQDRLSGLFSKQENINKALFTQKYCQSQSLEKIKEEVKDILAFLKTNTILEYAIKSSYGAYTLVMTIATPIKYFDSEPVEAYLKNKTWLEDRTHNQAEQNALKDLLTAIFITNEIELLTTTEVSLSLTNCNLHANYPRDTYLDKYFPHPHLARYSCFGENKTLIYQAITQSNIIGAINQIIAASYNFNTTDNVVFNNFCYDLMNRYKTIPCFKDVTTGKLYSYETFIKQYMLDQHYQELNSEEECELYEEN